MEDTIRKLSHIAGSQAKLAKALGMTTKQISRISTGQSNVPVYMVVISELLEALPPKDWPARWQVTEKTRPASRAKRR